MADVFSNGLGYFFCGAKDCLYGVVRIYKYQREAATKQQLSPTKQPKMPMGVLAQRRAAASPSPLPEERKASESKIVQKVAECCVWNGGAIWMSMLLFEFAVLPLLKYMTSFFFIVLGDDSHASTWQWVGPAMTTIFQTCWIVPMSVILRGINSLWFQDIANAVWKSKPAKREQKMPTIGFFIADTIFSIFMQLLFLLQSVLVNQIPIPLVGLCVGFLHLSLLYSLYAFEYRWLNQGYNLNTRLSRIENQWPYFLGFGLPFALLTSLSENYFINGSIYAILFPLLIVSANEAPEIRQSFDFPLRLFGAVVFISNYLLNKLPALGGWIFSKPSK